MLATKVVLFVAVLGVAAVHSAVTPLKETSAATLGDAIYNMVIAYKRIAPCGDSDLGIPVMAPFRQKHIKLNLTSGDLLSWTGDVNNLVITGLDQFVIIDISSTENRLTFDMMYQDINVLGNFDTDLFENVGGLKYHITPKGLLNIHFKDLRVSGGVTIGKNAVGGMEFSDIEYYIDLGDLVSETWETQWAVAVNQFFNKYVRDVTLLFMEEGREAINKAISGYLTSTLNNIAYSTTEKEVIFELEQFTQQYESVQCDV